MTQTRNPSRRQTQSEKQFILTKVRVVDSDGEDLHDRLVVIVKRDTRAREGAGTEIGGGG